MLTIQARTGGQLKKRFAHGFAAFLLLVGTIVGGITWQNQPAQAAINTWTQHDRTGKWGTALLYSTSVVSPTDVWVAGANGNVWHYDGMTWTQHSGTGKWGTKIIQGIHAISSTSVWIVGESGNVWHYDGTTWTQHSGVGKWGTWSIDSVTSSADNNVWITGDLGRVWQYDGTTWTGHSGTDRWGNSRMRAAFTTGPSDAWVVGSNGNVWHYDGSDWTQHSGVGRWGAANNVNSVYATNANDVWVSGISGNLWRYDGADWTQYPGGTGRWGGSDNLARVITTTPSDIWVLSSSGSAYHYDGSSWTRHIITNNPASQRLFDIDLSTPTNVWVAGESGNVWQGTETPLGFTTPTNKTVVEESTLPITDLALTGGSSNEVANINLFVPSGSLAFGSSTGLTFTGAATGNNLQFSGTKSAINAALATLQYTAGDTPGTFKLEALINEAGGGVIWSENGHAYKVVSNPLTWSAAKTAAEAQTFGGVPGYLATITSEDEHNFVLQRIDQSGWIGASDAGDEGNWTWRTGPETGMQFWSGNGATGSAVDDEFSNWSLNEPNDSGGNEDCAQIRFTESIHGLWNDLDCAAANPNYVVEFGTPENLPQVVQTSFNINVVPHAYTLTFDTDDGTPIAPIIGVEEGQTVTLPATPQRAGYIFDGWAEDSEANNEFPASGSFVMPDHDVRFVAQWKEDGNIDEVPDEEQENVVSLTDPTANKRVTLEVDDSCTVASATMLRVSDLTVKDSAYKYATDFVNFTATGCDNDKTTVNLYYYGTSPDGLTVRKHNPNKNSYFTINDALLTKRTIVGQNVTVVSYEVTDGGDLDIDGLKNGTIVDPVGLGSLVVGAPNTGLGGRNR